MTYSLEHQTLSSELQGTIRGSFVHFRGLQHGTVPARFSVAQPIRDFPNKLDCTNYGPRCPQLPCDVGCLSRVPPEPKFPIELEDEFKCLNLDVAVPKDALGSNARLPVLVWIHGGGVNVTYGSAASGMCDPRAIVEDSVSLEQPIAVVSIQYRVNIFAFGEDPSHPNLALEDQALALRSVQEHIGAFGGDPTRVTIAGESAGGACSHAHMVMNAPANQYILSSGSLYLISPLPSEMGEGIRRLIAQKLKELGDYDLKTAPATIIVEALEKCGGFSGLFLECPQLDNWQLSTGSAKRVMLSDVEREAIIWNDGIRAMDSKDIVAAFDLLGDHAVKVKQLYNVYPERPASCKTGALDFLTDALFVFPNEILYKQCQEEGKASYRCLIDEPSPWQPSQGANHAIELVLLFGGFDLSFSPGAKKTGEAMREKWIRFVNGDEPWPTQSYAYFGPNGDYGELEDKNSTIRRRWMQLEYLKHLRNVDPAVIYQALWPLAKGTLSLHN